MKVVVGSKLRVEVRKKSGHSIWAKYREATEVIDLNELFSDYWGSSNDEFTVMSQSSSPTSSHISSDRRTESIVIGKHSGSLEISLSANNTVRAFTFANAHLRRLIIFA